MTPASFGRRFAGLFVDWILCLLVAGLFGPLNGSVWPVVVLIVQHTFFVGLFGQTPGMFVRPAASTRTPAPPTTSRRALLEEATTGTPHAIASRAGRPNPS